MAASWAAPIVGQHELYIPAYFETENNVTSDRASQLSAQLADGVRLFSSGNTRRTRMPGLRLPWSRR